MAIINEYNPRKQNIFGTYPRQLRPLQQNILDWVAYPENIYFSQFWKLGSPRSKIQQWE